MAYRKSRTIYGFLSMMLAFYAVLTGLVACTKEGDTIQVPDPTDQPITTPIVTVVYDPDALGDRSYNDLICQGVEAAAVKYQLRTVEFSPITREEGRQYLEDFFRQQSTQQDTIRRLLIVASSAYDDVVRRNNKRLDGNAYADLLYFETSTPLDGKGSTLYLPYYGAMYEAGAITPHFYCNEVLLVGANREVESITEAIRGFQDGFATDYVPAKKDKRLEIEYLSNEADKGFSISDSVALQLMTKYDWDVSGGLPMIVPVCGGAWESFRRMSEITWQFFIMGVDVEKISANCHHSAVKHIGRALDLCIGQWLSAEGMPKHQTLGLSAGYTEVVVHPISSVFTEMISGEIPADVRRAIHEEAVRKEEAYEK